MLSNLFDSRGSLTNFRGCFLIRQIRVFLYNDEHDVIKIFNIKEDFIMSINKNELTKEMIAYVKALRNNGEKVMGITEESEVFVG